MLKENIAPLLTNTALMEALAKSRDAREAVADGFLYEQTLNMISADPGVGKSTIATQMAIELAAGLPLFGVFQVVKPLKVLYVQTERPIIELLERMDLLSKVYPITKENLFVTDEYQKLNMLEPKDVTIMLECLARDCPNPDIIFFDPIYSMVAGGLSQDVPASAWAHAMSAVQKKTHAIMMYLHHTSRPIYNVKDGSEIHRHDPSYGSRWLTAHVTSHYHLMETKEGVTLHKKKDNYDLMPSTIALHYDHETGLCTIPLSDLPAIEKVRNYLKKQELLKKPFTFNEICEETGLCTRTIRKVLMHSSIFPMVEVVSTIRNKKLYQIKAVKTA